MDDGAMLVLRRVLDEGLKIRVGDVDVFVHVVAMNSGFCRLGVRAPRDVAVERCDQFGNSQCKTHKNKEKAHG